MGRPVPEISTEALDAAHMRGTLQAVVNRRFGAGTALGTVEVERFERRLLRYTLEISAAGGSARPWHLIGKVYDTSELGHRGFSGIHRLWTGGFADSPPLSLRIPEPYTYVPGLRLLLMEQVPGRSLKKLVRKKTAASEHMRMFGAAMAKLHASPRLSDDPFTLDDHLETRCASLADSLASAFVDLAEPVRRIVDTARAQEARAGDEALSVAHGDFHLAQVQIADDRLWILDLDPLHVGDPAYDVAMALFALKQLEEKTADNDYVASLRDAFVAAYFDRVDWSVASRVPVQEALIHLKRACKRFRYQDEDGWEDTVRKQIGQAVACLDAGRDIGQPRSVAEVATLYRRCPATV